MQGINIYKDIAARTGGDLYLGVVGPVRSGKSTFIKRFMEVCVLPHMENAPQVQRVRDELPQSAQGKTVMTAEPKFIPNEAAEVTFGDAVCRIRMVDCVGFLIPGAIGTTEDGETRMVHTPWSEEPVPFEQAAQTGTEKVIRDHATVGILLTTDGSIGEFPREAYVSAEERTVDELRDAGKPFVIVCNSATPDAPESIETAERMEQTYGAPVALLDCRTLCAEDVERIMEMVLYEFPVREIRVTLPDWVGALPDDDGLGASLKEGIRRRAMRVGKLAELRDAFAPDADDGMPGEVAVERIYPSDGTAALSVTLEDALFYDAVREKTGLAVAGRRDVMRTLCELSEIKRKYAYLSEAIEEVEEKGYGIVMPGIGELKLEEPQIVRQNAGYGVKLKASAPSIHMIRAQIQAEVSPIVGTEQQTEQIVKYLLNEFEENPSELWETNLFGKSLHELINESLHSKLENMPDDARRKLGETIARIINEGSGGLICILL